MLVAVSREHDRVNALSVRISSIRARAVGDLADAAENWGCDVPGDPGIGELADVLGQAADHLPHGLDGRAGAATGLAMAVEELRAAARLGGLLPLVACHHLRLALQYERSARRALERSALPVT
jgi:hypothetical protein